METQQTNTVTELFPTLSFFLFDHVCCLDSILELSFPSHLSCVLINNTPWTLNLGLLTRRRLRTSTSHTDVINYFWVVSWFSFSPFFVAHSCCQSIRLSIFFSVHSDNQCHWFQIVAVSIPTSSCCFTCWIFSSEPYLFRLLVRPATTPTHTKNNENNAKVLWRSSLAANFFWSLSNQVRWVTWLFSALLLLIVAMLLLY
jgi:hypothetical protein